MADTPAAAVIGSGYDKKYIFRLLSHLDGNNGLDEKTQRKLIYFYASLATWEQIELERSRQEWLRKNGGRTDKTRLAETHYAALVAVLYDRREATRSHKKKNPDPALIERAQELTIKRLRRKRKTKSSPKRAFIETHLALIRQLLQEKNLSWREISDYLRARHKTVISHSYIQQTFTEIERG